MKSVFVTGTDTGVGKTAVCAALMAAAREKGLDIAPMKPVQTGCVWRNGVLSSPDLEFVLTRSGFPASTETAQALAPYRFQPACSPHLAAARAGVRIEVERIAVAFRALTHRHRAVVVEGAGGVLAPINEEYTMADLMMRLALPVVLVARPGLGTLNHTFLSLEALRKRALEVMAVVLVPGSGPRDDAIELDNRMVINKQGRVPVIGPLPFIMDFDPTGHSAAPEWKSCIEAIRPLLGLAGWTV